MSQTGQLHQIKNISISTPVTELEQLVSEMFITIGFPIEQKPDGGYNLDSLVGKLLPRDPFLGMTNAKKLDDYIPRLKSYLKSSALTSLHGNSKDKQKNPALNMFRQTLRCLTRKLTPVIISNGYCKHTGKKQYKRYYRVELK